MLRPISVFKRTFALGLFVMGAALTLAQPAPDAPSPLREGYVLVDDIALPIAVAEGRATHQYASWPNGKVPYAFKPYITSTNRARMRAAMDEWESVAGLTFIPRTTQPNYLMIGEFNGNWSYIGMIGGAQKLSMSQWDYHYVIMHELAHAMGFWHEQSRPDRDTYVTIMTANIQAGMENNFSIHTGALTTGPYDFDSVMHYGQNTFSNGSGPTIVAKPGYTQYQNTMGQHNHLSVQDKAGMRRLYPPKNSPLDGDTHKKAFVIPAAQVDYSHSIDTSPFSTTTKEPSPTCTTPAGATVWYALTPTSDRVVTIESSGFDTILAVYSGTPGSWHQHACADSAGSGGTESATVSLKAGVKHYIVVGGKNWALGTLQLNVHSERNLVRDGDFEWGLSSWNKVSVPSNKANDKILCSAPVKPAVGSTCAFQFKGGAGEGSSLTQTIKANALAGWTFTAGQTYTLSMSVASDSAASAVSLTALVTYHNGSTQSFFVAANGLFAAHTQVSAAVALTRSDVKKIKLTLTNTSLSGKTWVDNVRLRGPAGSPLRADAVLPPPAAPAEFRGTN